MAESVLRKNATITEDKLLIEKLVDKFMSGDNKHKNYCTNKIIKKVNTKPWQEKYYSRSYIFYLLYSIDMKV